ncbi:hypothetical protein [Bacillus benzoevorans]|uniref:DUF4355 domain-containing protein n=1 Tax=Bacillus benzoevorans TaxID=1456 RepID=A0A7X0HRS1_9BACI|nr:hypothetical protein [Bacillus benzoevorans]MBB6445629.1 hypothetical protein [Bacillus benzoevorans]
MSQEISFTQVQLDEAIANAKNEWVEKEFNPLVAERDDLLQYKPKELSDGEKAIQAEKEKLAELKKEFFQKDVYFSLKENGLEAFANVVKVENDDELKEVVQSLSKIVNDIKVTNGYVPNDHKQQNEYDAFASKKDTKGMIGTKLANLFK